VKSAAERDAQLARERDLLDMARSALLAHRHADALAAVAQHEADFERPMLAEERDALRIRVLVQAAQKDEAKRRLAAFEREYPQSLFSSALQQATKEMNVP
jgi:hypothetical protein